MLPELWNQTLSIERCSEDWDDAFYAYFTRWIGGTPTKTFLFKELYNRCHTAMATFAIASYNSLVGEPTSHRF